MALFHLPPPTLRRWVGGWLAPKMAEWEEGKRGRRDTSIHAYHPPPVVASITLRTTLPLSRQSRDGRRTNQLSRLPSLLLLLRLVLFLCHSPLVVVVSTNIIQPGPPYPLTGQQQQQQQQLFIIVLILRFFFFFFLRWLLLVFLLS